jgi:hypothetical protein
VQGDVLTPDNQTLLPTPWGNRVSYPLPPTLTPYVTHTHQNTNTHTHTHTHLHPYTLIQLHFTPSTHRPPTYPIRSTHTTSHLHPTLLHTHTHLHPYTRHRTPYALPFIHKHLQTCRPAPNTLLPTPYTQLPLHNPIAHTTSHLHTHTLHPTPHTLHPKPYLPTVLHPESEHSKMSRGRAGMEHFSSFKNPHLKPSTWTFKVGLGPSRAECVCDRERKRVRERERESVCVC